MKSKPYYIYLSLLILTVFFQSNHLATAQDAPQEKATLMEYVISERPLLAELLTTAGMVPILSGSTDYTLLAPPEASLKSLKGQPSEKIRAILSMHIIKGRYKASDFKEGAKVQTIEGGSLTVYRKKGVTLLNGVILHTSQREMRNGILLEVEGLLQP
jgi:uncharacterized surface protein with fasciclin (FAS1) repeats